MHPILLRKLHSAPISTFQKSLQENTQIHKHIFVDGEHVIKFDIKKCLVGYNVANDKSVQAKEPYYQLNSVVPCIERGLNGRFRCAKSLQFGQGTRAREERHQRLHIPSKV